jgi:hypothetical protein
MSGGRNFAILIASVAAVLVVGGSIGYVNSRSVVNEGGGSEVHLAGGAGGGEAAGGGGGGGGGGGALGGSSERDELLAMVKERDDTIKNLREKLEEAHEGREIDVRWRCVAMRCFTHSPFTPNTTFLAQASLLFFKRLLYFVPPFVHGISGGCGAT